MSQDNIISSNGLARIKAELERLSTTGRHEVAQRIKTAREFGDISENSEYDEAKNDQARLEGRIAQLEDRIRTAVILDETDIAEDVVQVGTAVTFTDPATGKTQTFLMVSSAEQDIPSGKLSNLSPIGKALYGHNAGETVNVQLPNGNVRPLHIDRIEIGSQAIAA